MSSFLRSALALAWNPLRSTSSMRTAASTVTSQSSPSSAVGSTSSIVNIVRNMSYKLKTNSAAKKRFVALPSGKFKHWKAGRRHLNTGMDRNSLNKAGKAGYATSRQSKHLRRLLPYA